MSEAAARRPDRAQYGVCGFLAVVGALVIVDAARLQHIANSNDPIGPKPVPIVRNRYSASW